MHDWAREWGNVANRSTSKGIWHEFTDYAVILQAALGGEGIALGWISVVSSALLKGTLVAASDLLIRTGQHHSLIAPRSKPLKPAIVDIINWLSSKMNEEILSLGKLMNLRSE
jgi:DNA-binding transcriptional LysR family regulator